MMNEHGNWRITIPTGIELKKKLNSSQDCNFAEMGNVLSMKGF